MLQFEEDEEQHVQQSTCTLSVKELQWSRPFGFTVEIRQPYRKSDHGAMHQMIHVVGVLRTGKRDFHYMDIDDMQFLRQPVLRFLKKTFKLRRLNLLFVNGFKELGFRHGANADLEIQQEHPDDWYCAFYPYWWFFTHFALHAGSHNDRLLHVRKVLASLTVQSKLHEKSDDWFCEAPSDIGCKCPYHREMTRTGVKRITLLRKFVADCLSFEHADAQVSVRPGHYVHQRKRGTTVVGKRNKQNNKRSIKQSEASCACVIDQKTEFGVATSLESHKMTVDQVQTKRRRIGHSGDT